MNNERARKNNGRRELSISPWLRLSTLGAYNETSGSQLVFLANRNQSSLVDAEHRNKLLGKQTNFDREQ